MTETRNHDTLTVLHRLQAQPDLLDKAKVVGRWVWITFESYPGKDITAFLKSEGFHWNHERRCWQHTGGRPSHHAPYDPRGKYGEVNATDLLQTA